eukprot:TRINITY_DN12336_c0_g2_i1.p1 TRINITY_DN12336_c0_g2~~TRINITY_DN12336_c0_g2_i1.p1  ORF type:complete len:183 (+),score=55.11 TRINITY_DN12336_c0_g2_i1:46-594(+)
MKKVKSTGEEQKKATGQKPRYVPEEEEEEYEVEQKEEGLLVKVSNCNEEFNDLSVRELLGEEGWAAVAEDGITWAVHKEELKFAGFGWIEFTDKKWAKTMVGFDVMGATSEKGKKVNRGDDLFVQYHDDGIPDGKCGWCGKNGHFARECNKRGREAMKYSPRYSKTGSSGSGYYDAKRQRQW